MRSWILSSEITSTRIRMASVASTVLAIAAVLASTAGADPVQDATQKKVDSKIDSAKKEEALPAKPEKLGVLINDSRALPGYNLINASGKKTYLFDNEGRLVHSWTSEHPSSVA